jgi:hypothetical protein
VSWAFPSRPLIIMRPTRVGADASPSSGIRARSPDGLAAPRGLDLAPTVAAMSLDRRPPFNNLMAASALKEGNV